MGKGRGIGRVVGKACSSKPKSLKGILRRKMRKGGGGNSHTNRQ